MNSINLLPPGRRQWLALRRRRRIWGALVAAYTTAAITTCGVIAGSSGSGLVPLSLEREREERRGALLRSELQKTETRLDEVNRKLDVARIVRETPDWRGLLVVVAEEVGEDVVLDGVDVRIQEAAPSPNQRRRNAKTGPRTSAYIVRLSGIARSQAAVAGYVSSLEQAEVFSTVRLDGTQSRTSGAGTESERYVSFAVTCTVRDDAPASPPEPARDDAKPEGPR